MLESHIKYLCCPDCFEELALADADRDSACRIVTGRLVCVGCGSSFPIVRHVPRFVSAKNYAENFGLEWSRHSKTQYDGESEVKFSERRFFEETKWPKHMPGETILEAGSGSGRFTEQAAATGAMVISFDLSYAVDINHDANGDHPNILIIQADIFRIPCRPESFDKIFCFGVLQHTPNPEKAFRTLQRFLKLRGVIVIDVYAKTFVKHVLGTKYWIRPFTRNLDPAFLYKGVQRYVDFMWPLASILRRIPRIGTPLNWRLLIGDYSNEGIPESKLKEWAYLDTFDMLAPKYDNPQTLETVKQWFLDVGLAEVDVNYGYNGIQGRGTRLKPLTDKS